MRRISRVLVVLNPVLFGFVCLSHLTAWAHGGTLRLSHTRVGPYTVSVWTQPVTPRVGELDVSVAVMRPQDDAPILDANVRVAAESPDRSGGVITAVAVKGAGGNRLLSHARLKLPSTGRWRIAIVVQGPAGKGGTAFEVQVQPSRQLWWPLAGIGGGITLMWFVWRRFLVGDHASKRLLALGKRGTYMHCNALLELSNEPWCGS
jgi:hypothetical protein